jgi:uncharacterized damage-inducible protein DinB
MPRRTRENTLKTREEFFARERASWEQFFQAWSDLPDEVLLRPGACGRDWSIKDVLNHTAVWQEAAVRMINGLLVGHYARLGASTDKFNAAQYAADHDRPLDESRARLMQSRRVLLDVLATVTDEQLLNEYGRQQIGWWAKWNSYAHYEHHTKDLQDFRRRYTS